MSTSSTYSILRTIWVEEARWPNEEIRDAQARCNQQVVSALSERLGAGYVQFTWLSVTRTNDGRYTVEAWGLQRVGLRLHLPSWATLDFLADVLRDYGLEKPYVRKVVGEYHSSGTQASTTGSAVA